MIIVTDNKTFDTDALAHEIESLTATVDAMKSRITGWRSKRSIKLEFIKNNIMEKRDIIQDKVKALNSEWCNRPNKTDEETSAIETLNIKFIHLHLIAQDLSSCLFTTHYQGSALLDQLRNLIVGKLLYGW